jgi:hypothetical protein
MVTLFADTISQRTMERIREGAAERIAKSLEDLSA